MQTIDKLIYYHSYNEAVEAIEGIVFGKLPISYFDISEKHLTIRPNAVEQVIDTVYSSESRVIVYTKQEKEFYLESLTKNELFMLHNALKESLQK